MHFSIKVSPEPATLQSTYPSGFQQTLPIHSQWKCLYKCLSHLTSSTSQEIFWSFSSIICSTYGQSMILTDISNSKILEPKGLWMMPLAFWCKSPYLTTPVQSYSFFRFPGGKIYPYLQKLSLLSSKPHGRKSWLLDILTVTSHLVPCLSIKAFGNLHTAIQLPLSLLKLCAKRSWNIVGEDKTAA